MAPLGGMRVLDLTRFVAGSYVTMALGALGAEVIKLEVPPMGDPYRTQGTAFVGDESVLFLCLNNGKRSVGIDFRSEATRSILRRLVDTADVIVQNARPGSLTRYGLDAKQVRAANPRAVYASISGYGEVGPQAARGGFDLVLQAEGGLMGITGVADAPPVAIGAPLLDIGAGASCLAAILAALLERQRTGQGAEVSSSLLEFSLAGMTTLVASYLASGDVPGPSGGHSPMFAPYGAFRARDGYLVLAGAGSEHLWRRLCDVVGQPELVDDSRFVTNAGRVRNRPALVDILERALQRRDADDWVEAFEAVGIPAGRPVSLDTLVASAQVRALDVMREMKHPTVGTYRTPAFPLRFDGTALAALTSAPVFGADTREVLEGLGCSTSEIDALISAGTAVVVK